MKRSAYLLLAAICFLLTTTARSSDWPIYKGNIYYTGNNDEITVKNSNLKWLYQADEAVFNPVCSGGRVYFTDLRKNVYCLDEETGKPVWKLNLQEYSSQFRANTRVSGAVKYPLIKGDSLFLTDAIAIYCLDKNTGRVLWARTGYRAEEKLENMKSWDTSKSPKWQPGREDRWAPEMNSQGIVDYIYSNPVIQDDYIFYGTRNLFLSREIRNGHLRWNNGKIKTYSGFPSFYGGLIFTQSMDYGKNAYILHCLDAATGEVRWEKSIGAPHRIFSPVVYRDRVYMAANSGILCLDLENGKTLWHRDYGDLVTSNPCFTDRSVVFTTGNRSVVMIDPETGETLKKADSGSQSSPYFVTIRDEVYVASSFDKMVGNRNVPFAALRGISMLDGSTLWSFESPFPGGAHQPAASGGIMYLPAGNYLYAVGTDYYPRIIKGGSAVYDPYMRYEESPDAPPAAVEKTPPEKPVPDEIPLREMKVGVTDADGKNVPSLLEIRKWDRGKLVYDEKRELTAPGMVTVPALDEVEITASSGGYAPRKVIVSKEEKEIVIPLDEIKPGDSIVMDNIYFEVNKAHLRKESLNILDRMIETLKANTGIRIEVRGHTDSTGPRAYNQKLSERRADAVVEYMVKNGIGPERLGAAGFGPDKPVADNATPEGRRKNRRTEFFILDK
ncbi:MAG TPA: PQQ-binding-like beta-propeller repeat protein [Spirochaetota bacterium]|nr:PQQ-binding-like beta-propeller repeat protein [Spirochaetota bacterium]